MRCRVWVAAGELAARRLQDACVIAEGCRCEGFRPAAPSAGWINKPGPNDVATGGRSALGWVWVVTVAASTGCIDGLHRRRPHRRRPRGHSLVEFWNACGRNRARRRKIHQDRQQIDAKPAVCAWSESATSAGRVWTMPRKPPGSPFFAGWACSMTDTTEPRSGRRAGCDVAARLC